MDNSKQASPLFTRADEIEGLSNLITESKKQHPDLSHAILITLLLRDVMSKSSATTNQDFILQAKKACKMLTHIKDSKISTMLGSEIFLRILGSPLDMVKDFSEWKGKFLEEVDKKIIHYLKSRDKAVNHIIPFIKDDMILLVHSYSTAVMKMLLTARNSGRRVKVFVTEALPSSRKGEKAVIELRAEKIPAELISDSSVGFIMEQIDMVVVGAEGIVQSGGIINQIGTLQIAIVAKEVGKPFYVLAEQYKFFNIFPLYQSDLPTSDCAFFTSIDDNITCKNPSVDYTPAEYITLYFTDLGVMTPTTVAEEFLSML